MYYILLDITYNINMHSITYFLIFIYVPNITYLIYIFDVHIIPSLVYSQGLSIAQGAANRPRLSATMSIFQDNNDPEQAG